MSQPHERETNYTDLPAGQSNLWFVDVSNVWTKAAAARPEKTIRKILIHQHAGFPHDFSVKHGSKLALSGEKMPLKYVDIAGWPEYQNSPYGYHYDIPFVGEPPVNGKLIVYVTTHADGNATHTGAHQNETGVGISMTGTFRSTDAYPAGDTRSFSQPFPQEYIDNPGLPSSNQQKILSVLVRYLQEKYDIADCHVQAHFHHGKPTCPGYDTERWAIDREERSRRKICYPVQLQAGSKDAPFLKAPDQELTRAKEYVQNTAKGRSGYFPFGRRHFWHNGIHLFPAGGKGSPVYAVRDGWISGARFDKTVQVDGIDYGSANFVVVHHEDPGIWNKYAKEMDTIDDGFTKDKTTGAWVPVTVNVAVHPTYFSLYLHLEPLDEKIGWVAKLKKKDEALFKKIQETKASKAKTYSFDQFTGVALPVKAGEIIGYVGMHDPFAGLAKKELKVAAPDIFDAKNQAVLHFEMFSAYNLMQRLDPDRTAATTWTLKDDDANALAEVAADKLGQLEGFKDHADGLKKKREDMESKDPTHADPSLWSTIVDDTLLNALSCVIANHTSEWKANWKVVMNGWYRQWGLAQAKGKEDDKRIEKTVKHHLAVIKEFELGWSVPSFSWRKPATAKYPFFYHPIRLLNWLNGLERTLESPGLPFYTVTGATPFDISPRNVTLQEEALKDKTQVLISKQTGNPPIADFQRLKGTRVSFPPSKTLYTISQTEPVKEEAKGLRVTLSPPLEQGVKKGGKIKLGAYGWHWETKFKWDTKILGS